MAARGLPRAVTGYSSWLIVNLSAIDPRAALLYPLMRLGGVHVQDGYPWFLTTAHEEADFERVAEVFAGALDRLQAAGIIIGNGLHAANEAGPDTAGPDAAGPDAAGPETGEPIPLTDPQREIWMAAQLGDAASGVFIEGISLRLEGPLDVAALEAALNGVIARHDALRLVFAPDGRSARVTPHRRLPLAPQDMDEAALADIDRRGRACAVRPDRGPAGARHAGAAGARAARAGARHAPSRLRRLVDLPDAGGDGGALRRERRVAAGPRPLRRPCAHTGRPGAKPRHGRVLGGRVPRAAGPAGTFPSTSAGTGCAASRPRRMCT